MSNQQQGQIPLNRPTSASPSSGLLTSNVDFQQRTQQPGLAAPPNVAFPVVPLSVPQLPAVNAGNAIYYNSNQNNPYSYQQNPQWAQGVPVQPLLGTYQRPQQVQGAFPGGQPMTFASTQLQQTGASHMKIDQLQAAPKAVSVPTTQQTTVAQGGNTSAANAQAEREAAIQELARFRKRKMDYRLPERLSNLVPESPLFAQMQDAERRIDNEIYRKKNEILEVFGVTSAVSENEISLAGAARRQMRVYVFGQKSKVDGKDVWSLTIHGRPIESLEDSRPGGGGSLSQSLHVAKIFFSNCLKSLRIELEGGGFEHEEIVWEKCRHDREHKEARFQIQRSGTCPKIAKIQFEIDHAKPVYTVPAKLEEILGLPSDLGGGVYSIPYIMGTIWNHAKKHDLLIQVGDIGKIKLDATLKDVVNLAYEAQGKSFQGDSEEFMSYSAFSGCVQILLEKTKPFTIEYSMENPDPTKPVCIDFHYEAPLVGTSQASAPDSLVEAKNVYQAEMEDLDVDLAELYHRYCDMESAHAILQAFALDPHKTLREILALHNKDPRSFPYKPDDHLEIMSQSSPYKDPWVDDAIIRYLTDAPGEVRRIHSLVEAEKNKRVKTEVKDEQNNTAGPQ
jgi:SWI/SNF-related matrix-associated actin-dependent regulator of chromatin subfamily D